MKNRDERIRKDFDETRASRAEVENIEAYDDASPLETQADSDRPFKDEFNFEALPNPNIGGDKNFHYFWATTTNSMDTPHRRMRMGYTIVPAEERPEFKHLRLKSGEFDGCISINEMIMMKLPMKIYQQYMLEQHHHKPNDRANMLKASAQFGHRDKNGRLLDPGLEEGYLDLNKPIRAPRQFE